MAKFARYTARHRYWQARWFAKKRGIDFHLTFDEWDAWWLKNGVDKNHSTGPSLGDSMCMCRYGDSGAYELGNIYCATRRQNSIDGNINSGIVVGCETPLGVFGSMSDAAKAHNIHLTSLKYRIRRGWPGYRYS